MGGNLVTRWARPAQLAVAALVAAGLITSCSSDNSDPTDLVGSVDAITAVVAWQADQQQPVLDANGDAQLPLIFVVADAGATIDVGVQAAVAEDTADWATVRFADDVDDTFDSTIEGEPVRDDGSMLLIGPVPDPAQSIELDLIRYVAADDAEPFTLEITAEISSDDTDPDAEPRAIVTAVTQP